MDNSKPLVSVIIPCYNCIVGIYETINSVLMQTYQEIEVIIVNDGSNEKTTKVLDSFKNTNVLVLQIPNSGASVARNKGVSVARGKYIQFLDAGDILHPRKIEKQIDSLSNSIEHVSVCYYRIIRNYSSVDKDIFVDQSNFIYSTDDSQDFLINLWGGYDKLNFIQTNCWLIPSDLIKNVGGWRNYRCPDDDGEFFARVVLSSQGIIAVPEVLNYYFMSEDDLHHLSRQSNYNAIKNNLLTIDLKMKYLKNKGNHELLHKAISSQYYVFAVTNYPKHLVLSAIAYRRFLALSCQPPRVLFGGRVIQVIYELFGWRIARIVKFYINKIY
jgi:glycosyltransferase involved in cell wall biosynthesis